MMETYRQNASILLEQQAAEVDKKMDQMSFVQLITEEHGMRKLLISLVLDALQNLKMEQTTGQLLISLPLPAFTTNKLGTDMVGAIGVLAALAIPNFQKARAQARLKSCYANMRVTQGAVEMYNMDNSEMMDTMDFSRLTGTNGYLKSEPRCPEGGNYSGYGLSKDGQVSCTVRGVVP
jgi:competence protein ComGC